MTSWRTVHNRRRRAMKRELKQARLRRLPPWQRDLLRAMERLNRGLKLAVPALRDFGEIVGSRPEFVIFDDVGTHSADAFAYATAAMPKTFP